MGLKYKKILGVKIDLVKTEKILEETRKYLKRTSKFNFQFSKKLIRPYIIFTPNPEIIIYAQKEPVFKEIVNSAQINIPDGIGISWALKRLFNIEITVIPGVDLMKKLCQTAEDNRFQIGLIGGSNGLAVETAECLKKTYTKLKIETLGEPEVRIGEEKDRLKILGNDTDEYFKILCGEINKKKIDMLFVALGFPKQEYFINKLKAASQKSKFKKPLVMMGVGGSFDYLVGRIPRAPEWMRERGFEWLFRLIHQPFRIKRQFFGAQFFLRVLMSR